MLLQEISKELRSFLPEGAVLFEEPMRLHTTFRIGGPADVYVQVASEEELARVLAVCHAAGGSPYIIGKGSNLLVADGGVRGVVVEIGRAMSDICVEGSRIHAKAGAALSAIARAALAASLDGFAFAAGIPGSLGGAAVMNAGAYGGEMKDVVETVRLLMPDGSICEKTPAELHFRYRATDIPEIGAIVTGACICLTPGKAEEIREKMEELRLRRQEKQPLDLPSAGSTFKRPEGDFAGRLIEASGLRGHRVGGAMVSEKHCGFVVNMGDATAADVCAVICDVRERVFADSGILLEPEVRFIGDFEKEEPCHFPGK